MRIQNLAVMFIILILPISLVLSSYTNNKIETLRLQTQYDSKLLGATYDALKTYQINNFNSTVGELTNTKIEDIDASINSFFNALSTTFDNIGYTKKTIQDYVPALVYTMYDGYYIYSPYTNKLDNETISILDTDDSSQYKNNQKLYGLKPYVYYSCRYSDGSPKNDIVITYSLDNYIKIQGILDNKPVSKSGYLLDNVEYDNNTVKYNGIAINSEQLTENVYIDGEKKTLMYKKIKGTKYYKEENSNDVFVIVNGEKLPQQVSANEIENNTSAINYYKEAFELKNFIRGNNFLRNLNTNQIVFLGNNDDEKNKDKEEYQFTGNIFDFGISGGIESETSNFNEHRRDVIKHSIIRNLSVAVSNFNNYSGLSTDFRMPKLKETDWDKIMNNISIISFLQGLNIGGKIYNGYTVVTNTKNEDVVMEDSIYIKNSNTNTIHKVTENMEVFQTGTLQGIYNVNLERRSAKNDIGNSVYYFPVEGTLSYGSIVSSNNIDANANGKTTLDYVKTSADTTLKQAYYTALARERYSLNRQDTAIKDGEY